MNEAKADTRSLLRYPVLLTLLWLIFVAFPIGNRGLWAPDEPRYLQVAWEMSTKPSYVVPVLNGELYSHKPPLFFWLTILLSKVASFETASRWLSALACLGILLLTYRFGEKDGSGRIGFTAALILMTSGLYAWLMGNGNMDMLLTFLVTLSLYLYRGSGWQPGAARSILIYGTAGIAILAKGPVGLLIPWLTMVAWYVYRRARRLPVSGRHLVWGPVIALVVAALWVVPACVIGGEQYTRMILVKQNFGRAVSAFSHARPWYYFFINLPVLALPWFLLIPGGRQGFKRLLTSKERPLWFYLVWAAAVFVFFSLLSGKRGRYMLPLFPALSLIAANLIHDFEAHGKRSRLLAFIGYLVLACGAAIFAYPLFQPLVASMIREAGLVPLAWRNPAVWGMYGLAAIWGAAMWKAFRSLRARQAVTGSRLLALALLILLGAVQMVFVPWIDPVKSAARASRHIEELLPPGGHLAFLEDRYDNGWNFYLKTSHIPVVTAEDVLERNQAFDLIIARSRFREQIKNLTAHGEYRVETVLPVGSKEFYLIRRIRS